MGASAFKFCYRIKDFFLENNISDILIPGIGYGRNAKIFYNNATNITSVEISKSAIELVQKNISKDIKYCGSVTEMPFDPKKYKGIFCYSLTHLLNRYEKKHFILN